MDPSVKRLAVHVEDHPLEYKSFEGVIPKGQYGSGTVVIWDKGEWTSLDPNPNQSYRKGDMSFSLQGKKLRGEWKLIRMNKNDKTWLLIKVKDRYAKSLAKSNDPFPKAISPALSTLVSEPPSGKNWIHEVKFDGYRVIAIKSNQKTQLLTRNKQNWTNKFPNIAYRIDQLSEKNLILDGEIVVLDDDNMSNFQALQSAIKNKEENFIYYVFDLLYFDSKDTTSMPLIERKKLLKELLPKIMPIFN